MSEIRDNMVASPAAHHGVELSAFGYVPQLNRTLSLADLFVYGLVFIVPIAPFAIFGIVFNASRGMVPLTYLIGLVAMVFTALSYRAMSEDFPVAGSVYAYASRGLHPSAGFLAGWAILLDYLLIPTLCYVAGAAAMQAAIPAIPESAWVIAFVFLNTAINLLGIETTARASRVFLVGELFVLGAFVVLGAIAVDHGVNGAHWSMRPFFNPGEFHVSLIFGALSVAVLSFLGFDAISTLAEETKGGTTVVGRATLITLGVAAALFIVQTYIAALLVPNRTQFVGSTEINDAFYSVSALVGGHAFKVFTALSVALSTAFANSLVAQAATARLLFAMARDRQLPRFLAQVHPVRKVPERAVLLVSIVSLACGLLFVGQLKLLSSLVNFGALFSFLMLHVAVVGHFIFKKRSRAFGTHLLLPAIGFVIIGFVLANADIHAKVGGLIWLGLGMLALVWLKISGRSTEIRLDA